MYRLSTIELRELHDPYHIHTRRIAQRTKVQKYMYNNNNNIISYITLYYYSNNIAIR